PVLGGSRDSRTPSRPSSPIRGISRPSRTAGGRPPAHRTRGHRTRAGRPRRPSRRNGRRCPGADESRPRWTLPGGGARRRSSRYSGSLRRRRTSARARGSGGRERAPDPGLAEPLPPELARVADPARLGPTVIAGPGEGPRHPELLPRADDVRLRQADERSADLDDVALDAPFRAETGDLLEGRVVFRPAIRVSRIVDSIG